MNGRHGRVWEGFLLARNPDHGKQVQYSFFDPAEARFGTGPKKNIEHEVQFLESQRLKNPPIPPMPPMHFLK